MKKRKAPNGCYWVTVQLNNGKLKLVIGELLDSGKIRCWSNSSITKAEFKESKIKNSWWYKDYEEQELYCIHDW